MSKTSTVPNSRDEFGLSLDELAILEFTNGDYELEPVWKAAQGPEGHGTLILTTKESYVWPVVVADVLRKRPDMTEEELLEAIRMAGDLVRWSIKEHYAAFSFDMMMHPARQASLFMTFLTSFVSTLGLLPAFAEQGSNRPGDEFASQQFMLLQGFFTRTSDAMRSLVEKNLIEDPVELEIAASVGVAVLGLIPVGFTKKTSNGITTYRKIAAGYWSYEMSRRNGVKTENFSFRFIGLLRAFKKALIEEFGKH